MITPEDPLQKSVTAFDAYLLRWFKWADDLATVHAYAILWIMALATILVLSGLHQDLLAMRGAFAVAVLDLSLMLVGRVKCRLPVSVAVGFAGFTGILIRMM